MALCASAASRSRFALSASAASRASVCAWSADSRFRASRSSCSSARSRASSPLSAAAVTERRLPCSATGGGRVADEYCGDSTGAVVGQPTLGGVAAGEATGRGAAFLVEEVAVALADRDPRRAGGVTVRVRARADKLPLRSL